MKIGQFATVVTQANELLSHRLPIEFRQGDREMEAVVDLRAVGDAAPGALHRFAVIRTPGTELVLLELDSEWFRPFFWDDEDAPEQVARRLLEICRAYGLGQGEVVVERRGLFGQPVTELKVLVEGRIVVFHQSKSNHRSPRRWAPWW